MRLVCAELQTELLVITVAILMHSLPIGAFGAHPDHDAHLLPTLSAIQILLIHDALDQVDIPRVVSCVSVIIIRLSKLSFLIDIDHRCIVSSERIWVLLGRSMGRDRHKIHILCCVDSVSPWEIGRTRCGKNNRLPPKMQKF
jgi:prenyltransferase beta subunit